MNHFRPLLPLIFSVSAVVGLLFITGCETRPARGEFNAEAVPRPVALSGTSTFFGGQLGATITVSRGPTRPGGPAGREQARGGGRRGDGRQRGGEPDQANSYSPAIHRASPLPPVTIRLILENRTPSPMEVEITEVSSALGNFAVRPEKLTLAPNRATEPDPMFSQLGVTSDAIPVTVGLKTAGMNESEVLIVKTVSSADAPTVAP